MGLIVDIPVSYKSTILFLLAQAHGYQHEVDHASSREIRRIACVLNRKTKERHACYFVVAQVWNIIDCRKPSLPKNYEEEQSDKAKLRKTRIEGVCIESSMV